MMREPDRPNGPDGRGPDRERRDAGGRPARGRRRAISVGKVDSSYLMSRYTNNTMRRANCTAGRRPFSARSNATSIHSRSPIAGDESGSKRHADARFHRLRVPRNAQRAPKAAHPRPPSASKAAPRLNDSVASPLLLVARGACAWNSRARKGTSHPLGSQRRAQSAPHYNSRVTWTNGVLIRAGSAEISTRKQRSRPCIQC